jgi:predicted transport protein
LQSFNDFDQHELTHKNLYGKLSGTIQFSIPIDGKFDPDFRKINAQSNVRVTNGRLYNFAPIEALSRFADIEELRDIRFEELTNKLVIENQMIHIPQFSVRSNALDLILEGTHTFDNEVDYKVGLNLSDIVYQKRKRKTSINELIFEEDQDGAKLWIRISGNITSPKITPIKAELISQKTTIFRNSKAQSQDSIPSKKPSKTPYRFEWDEL